MRQDGDCRGFLEGAVLSVGDGKKEAKARRGLGDEGTRQCPGYIRASGGEVKAMSCG